jgi:hypothetical protein
MNRSREDWETEFEKLDAGEVQARLDTNVYLQGESGGFARAWLARVREASQAEQLSLARAAAAEARAASQLAKIANKIAAAALAVAIVAAFISLWK